MKLQPSMPIDKLAPCKYSARTAARFAEFEAEFVGS